MHSALNEEFLFREGGWLASIEDPSEQEFIESNIKIFQDSETFFWTGLYKNHKGMVHCLFQHSNTKKTNLQL